MLKKWLKGLSDDQVNTERRGLFGKLAAATGLMALASQARAETSGGELRFPGDPAAHNVVYQFNKADEHYHDAVLFSVGEMIRKYGDNIRVVVVAFGPGLHILAKNPTRPVKKEVQQRVSSLSQYGVEFHACGNTMKALKWTDNDMVSFAKVVEVGASDLMELQEQGFSYISW